MTVEFIGMIHHRQGSEIRPPGPLVVDLLWHLPLGLVDRRHAPGAEPRQERRPGEEEVELVVGGRDAAGGADEPDHAGPEHLGGEFQARHDRRVGDVAGHARDEDGLRSAGVRSRGHDSQGWHGGRGGGAGHGQGPAGVGGLP